MDMNTRFNRLSKVLGPLATAKIWYLTGSLASPDKERKAPHTFTNGGICLAKGWPQRENAEDLDTILTQLSAAREKWDDVQIGFVSGLEYEGRVLVVIDIDDHHPKLRPVLFTNGKLNQLGKWLVGKFVDLQRHMVLVSRSGRGIHIYLWIDKNTLKELPRNLFYEDDPTGRTIKIEILSSNFVNVSAKFLHFGPIKHIAEDELLSALENFECSGRSYRQSDKAPQVHKHPADATLNCYTKSKLESALACVSSDDRENWIKFGLALALYEEEGFTLWHDWSKKSAKYKGEDDCRNTWTGFSPRGEISIGSIFYEAQEQGWCPPTPIAKLSEANVSNHTLALIQEPWDEPLPLTEISAGAENIAIPFKVTDVSKCLQDFVQDVARRLCVPIESVTAATLTAISGLVGSQAVMRPKARDSWAEPLNQWSLVVAPPGSRKSPMFNEVLKPIYALEAEAQRRNQALTALYEADPFGSTKESFAHREQRLRSKLGRAKKLLTQHEGKERNFIKDVRARFQFTDTDARRLYQLVMEEPKEPIDPNQVVSSTLSTVNGVKDSHEHQPTDLIEADIDSELPPLLRYIVNDATPEALEKVQADNPKRLLFFCDEISRLAAQLTRTGWQNMRGQLLEAWTGYIPHTSDRILRGSTHVSGSCLSLLGGIQPSALAKLIQDQRDSGDDGFIQRFTFLVAPDELPYKIVDTEPNTTAQDYYKKICNTLADEAFWTNFPGEKTEDGSSQLHFCTDAQQRFYDWLQNLDNLRRLESDPIMQGALSKVGGETAALAALLSLCDSIAFQSISAVVNMPYLQMAIGLYEKILTHWRKVLKTVAETTKQDFAARVFRALMDSNQQADVRTLQRKVHGSKAEDIKAALEFLQKQKWVKPSGSNCWLASPLVLRQQINHGRSMAPSAC